MKRSEVVKRLSEILSNFERANRDWHGTDDLADIILIELEHNMGMLPPFSFAVADKNWKKDREMSNGGNEWEPEDA